MTTYFVSRHLGAKEWALSKGFCVDQMVEHLALELLQQGDVVLGTLPINLVADLNEKGVRYWHLILPLTADLRGKEISAQMMSDLGARLEEYSALRNKTNTL